MCSSGRQVVGSRGSQTELAALWRVADARAGKASGGLRHEAVKSKERARTDPPFPKSKRQ
jgi:hypothetical protein